MFLRAPPQTKKNILFLPLILSFLLFIPKTSANKGYQRGFCWRFEVHMYEKKAPDAWTRSPSFPKDQERCHKINVNENVHFWKTLLCWSPAHLRGQRFCRSGSDSGGNPPAGEGLWYRRGPDRQLLARYVLYTHLGLVRGNGGIYDVIKKCQQRGAWEQVVSGAWAIKDSCGFRSLPLTTTRDDDRRLSSSGLERAEKCSRDMGNTSEYGQFISD